MSKIKVIIRESKKYLGEAEAEDEFGNLPTPEEEQFNALRGMITPEDIDKTYGFEEILHMGYVPVARGNVQRKASHGGSTYRPKFLSHLGSGVFGDTYEVADKAGKVYAAKVVDASVEENKEEFLIRTSIEEKRNNMPPEVAKHIVKLHEAKRLHLHPESDEVFVFIMDKARKMTPTERDLLFEGVGFLQQRIVLQKLFGNPQTFLNFFKKVLTNNTTLESGNTFIEIGKIKNYKQYLFETVQDNAQKIGRFKIPSKGDGDKVASRFVFYFFRDLIDRHLMMAGDALAAFAKKSINPTIPKDEVASKIRTKTLGWLQDILSGALTEEMEAASRDNFKFVTDSSDFNEKAFNESDAPESVKSFINALLYLKNNYNMKWNDLHSDNVMMNWKTGDYMAVDVGLFEFM